MYKSKQTKSKQIFCIFYPLFMFTGCATILNDPIQRIYISSDKSVKIDSVYKVIYKETVVKNNQPSTAYYVPRSPLPLKVVVQIDSIEKPIWIKSRNSFAYWSNIYFNDGLGCLIDRNNPKRYGYPIHNFLTANDTLKKLSSLNITRSRFEPPKKNTLELSISPTCITNFEISRKVNKYTSGGIFGIEASLGYYFQNKRFLSIGIGAATDKLPVDYFGYIQRGTTSYLSIKDNWVIKDFDFGYGLQVSNFQWKIITDDSTIGSSLSNVGIGLSLSTQYRIGNNSKLGVLYQPTFWNASFSPSFDYQHYFSVYFSWRLFSNQSKITLKN